MDPTREVVVTKWHYTLSFRQRLDSISGIQGGQNDATNDSIITQRPFPPPDCVATAASPPILAVLFLYQYNPHPAKRVSI